MKRLFSVSVTSTFIFILSVLAIVVIAVSAPGMVQAVLGPAAAPGDTEAGSATQESPYYGPKVNPAANFGSLTDNGTAAYMGIGTASPVSPLHIYSTSSTQPETIDLDGAQPITAQWNDYCPTGGSFSGSGFLARFAHGTRASPSNVAAGDRLGFNVFGGWAGTGFKHTAAIEAIVGTGTISNTSLPTYMKFSTTPDGSATRVERMRISADGNVGIGTASPGAKLHAETSSGLAVYGWSMDGFGVTGDSSSGEGVHGNSSGSGVGVYGTSMAGLAGYFDGKVYVNGTENVTGDLNVAGRAAVNITTPDSLARMHVVNSDATTGAAAIFGQETAGGGADTAGVLGRYGAGTVLTGTGTKGMLGTVGAGVYGWNEASHNNGWIGGANEGVWGHNNNSNYGKLGTASEGVYGRYGDTGPYGQLGTSSVGVYGQTGDGNSYGVSGKNTGIGNGGGVYGEAGNSNQAGVYGKTTVSSGAGVEGMNTGNNNYGYLGYSGFGALGHATSSSYGVWGEHVGGPYGYLGSSSTGVYGYSGAGYAGYFAGYTYVSGNCTVTGTMFKGGGAFKIDHPQDPENKYLLHSFVESPDMMNIYNGNITLDGNGEAVVQMPSYFDVLNRDFRYQLTAIGAPGPNLYIAEEISDNHFSIAGGKAGMKVSWMVTGVRQDAYAKAHPIIVEEEKPANEVGLYLHPLEWGQPESKGIAQLHKPAGAPTLAKAE